MRIKSYFAHSVQEAIDKARLELGPDAMLMNSRKTDPELRQLGTYEVVFGLADNPAASEPLAPAAQALAVPNSDVLIEEIAELRRQIETVKRSVSRPAAARNSAESEEMHANLCAAGFSEDTAQEILQAADKQNVPVIEEIGSRFQISPGIGTDESGPRILVLVGPPGAGKTTTLVKLALKYGVASRNPIQILSTDTLRVGGSDQLAAYARILGVGFQAIHSTASLATALEENRSKKLIFIDTPGYSAGNIDEAAELTRFLAAQPNIDVQLVLPATLRVNAASRILKRFTGFHPGKLIFTHFDEAETLGAMLELAMRTKLPISYLGTGQQIPEDLEEASKPKLTAGLSNLAPRAALSAA
jgi:flagellar biosynthesis protein FlhF